MFYFSDVAVVVDKRCVSKNSIVFEIHSADVK